MYTIGKLADEFGLSRSTLLYYDSLGLLKSQKRTKAGYRIYGETEYEKLIKICTYREMGLPLKEIRKLLKKTESESAEILQAQLLRLSDQIRELKKQQFAIIELLKQNKEFDSHPVVNKEQWVKILRSSGLTDEGMHRWHIEFERLSPQGHHDFLASLGISDNEIIRIRMWAKQI